MVMSGQDFAKVGEITEGTFKRRSEAQYMRNRLWKERILFLAVTLKASFSKQWWQSGRCEVPS
jgi:hypothetical protein